MADNSWMLPPKLRYKQRKFGCKEAEMLMMCNNRSQEAELARRYQRLDVAFQDFLRKYRHEVWEVRHFLRNIGRIERQNRVLLPTEKYEEDIFNAKLKAHNLKKRKRQQERQQAEELPYAYDTTTTTTAEDEAAFGRLTDMMDRSLSLTASSLDRSKSLVTFEDPEESLEPILPDLNKRSRRKGSTTKRKRRKKSESGNKGVNQTPSAVRRTPTGLDTIAEDDRTDRPPLRTRTSKEQLARTLSTLSQGDRELVTIVQPLRGFEESSALVHESQKVVHLPKIETSEIPAVQIV